MALQPQDIENFTTTVEDAVSYPILTRETSDYPYSRNGSASSNGTGLTAPTRTAMQTIRNLLGWRYRTDDPKGFLAALNKSIGLREFEGRIVWDWKPQTYMVQADMGEITGAQASVYKQASVVLENTLPLLDGLTPLRTDSDAEDIEAMRAIIRTELTELVGELGVIGGPRVQRVDSFFERLIGTLPPNNFDPEHVKGQLASLRRRFGLIRTRVNTISEEQTLTNFLILIDYVNSLYQSWNSKRDFFNGRAEPFLGTQLVLLSELLDAILEQLQEIYEAMDSVFFGPAERQIAEIVLADGSSMTVTEILSWVQNFAAVEGRQLIQEGGKDGVVVFNLTMVRLRDIVQEVANISAAPSSNPVRPFHTRRVALALGELGSYLSTAVDRASEISRRTFHVSERLGEEENKPWLKSDLIPSGPLTRVLNVEWFERLPKGGNRWLTRKSGDLIFPDDEVRIALWGSFPSLPLSLKFDPPDITVDQIDSDPSKKKVVALAHVSDTAKSGPRSLLIEDCEQQKITIEDALIISPQVQQAPPADFAVTTMTPPCAHQGETKWVEFEGVGLSGCGVCFGSGDNIRPRATTYSDHGTKMNVQIAISPRARIGEYTVDFFTADGGSFTFDKPFEVFAEVQRPLGAVVLTSVPEPVDPCGQAPPPGDRTPSDGYEAPAGGSDPADTPEVIPEETLKGAPAAVQFAATAAHFTGITDYQYCQVESARESREGGDARVRIIAKVVKEIDTAWLVYSEAPPIAIGPGEVTQKSGQATILFALPAKTPSGAYDVVIFMKDKSVEHAVQAVTLKQPTSHATS